MRSRYPERSLKTVDDVTALLADPIEDLGMGLIDPKEATAVGYLAAGMLSQANLHLICTPHPNSSVVISSLAASLTVYETDGTR